MFNYLSPRSSGLPEFRRELDRLFDDFWSTPSVFTGGEFASAWHPMTDIEEADDHFLLTIDVPGMKKEDLNIEIVNDSILISGERKQEEKSKGYSERRYGRFQRAFALPTHVEAAKIEAQYSDGVLRVYVPKSEAAKPKTVKIGDSDSGGIFSRLLGSKSERKTIDVNKGDKNRVA